MNSVKAPISYYGGKGMMRAKLLHLIPLGGKPYCEPFSGAGWIFFARQPAPVEVLNDLDGRIVNLFRVLQSPDTFEELKHRLTFTPYALAEFAKALEIMNDESALPVLRAWATFVAFNQAYSGSPQTRGNWSRTFVSRRGMASNVSKWLSRLNQLEAIHKRLMRVQIDQRDAIDVIEYWDNQDAVFYCDPPYHHETRANDKLSAYQHEQDHAFHERLVATLMKCQGAVVLSGYNHDVYAPLTNAGWDRIEFIVSCDAAVRGRNSGLQGAGAATGKVPRTEVVWRNPIAVEKTTGRGLFANIDTSKGDEQ